MVFRHTAIYAILVSSLVFAVRVGWYHHENLVPDLMLDDAYISFRFAENLADGRGLVFNPGERIEGYTNFLWTVLLAGAMVLGVAPTVAAEVLAGLAGLASIVFLALLAQRLLRGPLAAPAAFLPPLLFAAIGSQARHVVSGMETLLFVGLVLGAFGALFWGWNDREPPIGGRTALLAGALFALASMTRPEGTLFTALGGLMVLVEAGRSGLRRRLATTLIYASGFLVLYGPYTLWRLRYYGHLLPNTFYAKVDGPVQEVLGRGWASLGRLMADWPVWPVLALALLALPLAARPHEARPLRPSRPWAWMFVIVAATWGEFVFVGGDFLVYFGPRMLMPALPFVLLLAAEGLRRTTAWGLRRRRAAWVVAVLVAGLTAYPLTRPWPRPSGRLGGIALTQDAFHATADWLLATEAASPGPAPPSVATPAAGIVPYETGWETVDMYGLVDEHIAHAGRFDPKMPPAHAKNDPVYVLGRRPEYVLSELTPAGVPLTAGLGWVAERMARDYELVAQVKMRRGPRVRGHLVVGVDRFRPGLFRRGYLMGIFRRKEPRLKQTL